VREALDVAVCGKKEKKHTIFLQQKREKQLYLSPHAFQAFTCQ